MAAMQPQAAQLAWKIGDALVNDAPNEEIVQKFDESGGLGQAEVRADDGLLGEVEGRGEEDRVRELAERLVEGAASQELPLPSHFEQLVEDRDADEIEGTIPLGPDADEYLEHLGEYDQAGYTHVCVHQIGSDQKGFLEFAKRELGPEALTVGGV